MEIHACIPKDIYIYIYVYVHSYTQIKTHAHMYVLGARESDKDYWFPWTHSPDRSEGYGFVDNKFNMRY